LYSLVAARSARFALRFAIQPMWIRVVTGSDIVVLEGKKKPADCSAGFLL